MRAGIADEILREIYAHAEEAHPQECCGIVVMVNGDRKVIRSENKAPDPYTTFLLDSKLYLKHIDNVEFVYHSHPAGDSTPSAADKASCEASQVPYLIVGWPTAELSRVTPTGYRAPLIGRSFVYGVFDCYSLVKDYYAEELGLTLDEFVRPPYGWWREAGAVSTFADNYESQGFVRVEGGLQSGDVTLMMLGPTKVPNHIGVIQDNGLLLHQTLHNISHEIVYGGYWRKNTVGVFRHESMR